MHIHKPLALALFTALILASAQPAYAADIAISIRDHRFVPEVVHVPAGERIRLIVRNEDATAEEFESYALNREKVIPGKTKAVIFIGPLPPGSYPFFGEFHPDTATGRIVAE